MPSLREDAGEDLRRQRVVGKEARQQHREQPVLVLRPLRPHRYEVRELEPARRRLPRDDLAVVVADLLVFDLPPLEVLAYVVEVDADRRRGPTCRPVLRRRLEADIDTRAVDGIAEDEPAQRIVHVVDHTARLPRARTRRERLPHETLGSARLPFRASTPRSAPP